MKYPASIFGTLAALALTMAPGFTAQAAGGAIPLLVSPSGTGLVAVPTMGTSSVIPGIPSTPTVATGNSKTPDAEVEDDVAEVEDADVEASEHDDSEYDDD